MPDPKPRVNLPSGQSHSGFAPLPLLNFAMRRRCRLAGGPGRGNAAMAVLMGVLALNYAELLGQVYACPPAALRLTANGDSGGDTYQVIEALRDRIDIVVKTLRFNNHFLNELLIHVDAGVELAEIAPPQNAFTEAEAENLPCAARLAPARSRCGTFPGAWQGCLSLRPCRLDPALVCLACAEYHRLNLSQRGQVADLATEFSRGLEDNGAAQARAGLVQVERVPVEP